MYPGLIQIGSKTAEKNSAQTDRQTDRHYENNGHLAVNQKCKLCAKQMSKDGGITSRPSMHRHQTSRCAVTSLTSWTTMLVVGKFGRFIDAVSKTTTTFPVPRAPTQVVSRWQN